MSPAVTPGTEAGRALLRRRGWAVNRDVILAIEAEARAAVLAEVRALPTPKRYENDTNGNWFTTDMEYGWDCAIETVLRLSDGGPTDG
jgi:hypothetical protein